MLVPFVDNGGGDRAQMAAGWARKMLKTRDVDVTSAAMMPTFPSTMAVNVMAEIGIDIRDQRSERLSDFGPDGIGQVVAFHEMHETPAPLERIVRLTWTCAGSETGLALGEEIRRLRDVRQKLEVRAKGLAFTIGASARSSVNLIIHAN
ncbi:hypothetical protein [Phenylobacterium sp.]|uniref:hypothetical protein n=1 Tax=Phenylobacterium sp. TaxID=1871053 RepID=UPI003BAB3975